MKWNVMMGLLLAVALGMTGCGGGAPSIPAAPASDFTGTWAGTYNGTAFRYIVSQSGNDLNITRTTPAAAGLTYSGSGSGDTAVINTYGNGTYAGYTTWSKTSSTTMSVYLNSCVTIPGFACGAANGITLNLDALA
jgi:hypothetical protein